MSYNVCDKNKLKIDIEIARTYNKAYHDNDIDNMKNNGRMVKLKVLGMILFVRQRCNPLILMYSMVFNQKTLFDPEPEERVSMNS